MDLPNPGVESGSPAMQEDSLPAELRGRLQKLVALLITSVFLITSNSFLSQRIPVWVIRPLLRPFFVAFFLNCLHVSLLEDSGFISSAVTAGSFLKRHSP